MFLFSFVNLPTATSTFASISPYSSAMFDELLPLAFIVIGFSIGGFLIGFLAGAIIDGIGKIFHRDRD